MTTEKNLPGKTEIDEHLARMMALTELSKCQRQLRQAFIDAWKASGLSLYNYAISLGAHPGGIKAFSEGKAVVSSGALLKAVYQAANQPDLQQKTDELLKNMPKPWQMFSVFDEEALAVIGNVWEQWLRHGQELGRERFSKLFGDDYCEMVFAMLRFTSEPLHRLDDKGVREALFETYTADNFTERVQHALRQEATEAQKRAERWKSTRARLQEAFPTRQLLAKALGCQEYQIQELNQGKTSPDELASYLRKAEELLKEPPRGKTDSPDAAAQAVPTEASIPTMPPAKNPTPSDTRDLRIVTAENYIALDVDGPSEFIAEVRRRIEMCTLMLNAVAQIKDTEVMNIARQELREDITHLYFAIQLVMRNIPLPQLLELLDAQRQGLAAFRGDQAKTK